MIIYKTTNLINSRGNGQKESLSYSLGIFDNNTLLVSLFRNFVPKQQTNI